MDDESGEPMEPMEEVSFFYGAAYQKSQSVVTQRIG